jgi:2-keto-3-deoxy-6-phosphogluconate aldolase
MPQVRVMVTGGISIHSARELLDAGCAAAGLGSIHADASLGADPTQRPRAAVALVGRENPSPAKRPFHEVE